MATSSPSGMGRVERDDVLVHRHAERPACRQFFFPDAAARLQLRDQIGTPSLAGEIERFLGHAEAFAQAGEIQQRSSYAAIPQRE